MTEETTPLNSMERPQLLAHCLSRGREIARLQGELATARASVTDAADNAVDPVLSIQIDEARRLTMEAYMKTEQAHLITYRMQQRREEIREALEGRITPDDNT